MEGFTGFTKSVTIAAGQSSSITFTSPNGSAVQCNKFIFTASDGGALSGTILFVPSSVLTYANQPLTSYPVGTASSGVYGYHFKYQLDLTLGHGRSCRAATLSNIGPSARTIVVTYGIEIPVNPIIGYKLGVNL